MIFTTKTTPCIEARQISEILKFESYGLTTEKPFFKCPKCDKRTQKLYFKNGSMGCQKCQRIRYESQLITKEQRMLNKAVRLRLKLGGNDNLHLPFPKKPEQVAWKTYAALFLEYKTIMQICGRALMEGKE